MKRDDLKQGKTYALRPKRSGRGGPLIKVTFVGAVHGRQCKISHEEGDLEGLEEWIQTRQLACAWGEQKALLCDEERSARLAASDEDVRGRITEETISAVMTASREDGGFAEHWDTNEAPAERYWGRCRLNGTPWVLSAWAAVY
ncbi:hypothetical protein [Brevibacterium zhoupengii]|uniref:hypothetical protein n=1 Tax=Brevibacterium zhoupengii TaxID=2898795 RepID=UPI001F096F77|nr:hypothetical protein [Brevibacterium zhoupengii]